MASVKCDLLIVTDATGSMGHYLTALRQALPEILALSQLTGTFENIGIVAYRDYSDSETELIEWSGWNSPEIVSFASELQASGGGDYPEAAKTALLKAFDYCSGTQETLVLWYTDAPPHTAKSCSPNADQERTRFGKDETDWVKLAFRAKDNRLTVFSFIPENADDDTLLFFTFLSDATEGRCIKCTDDDSNVISRLTLDIVLKWSGLLENYDDKDSTWDHFEAEISRYEVPPQNTTKRPVSEKQDDGYLNQIRRITLQPFNMHVSIPVGPVPVSSASHNLSKKFANPEEDGYRTVVYKTLASIIDFNVYALSYNPVFGQLWRAVCKRESEEKRALVDSFSVKVARIDSAEKRAEMQQWLEESFDSTEEIEAIIAQADPLASNTRIYLDLDSGIDLTRRELLEVTKSCYHGVLSKLAAVFVHLKAVEDGAILAPGQRTIPLSLRPRDLFRTLPHLVVPGTLYPHRAASIVAVLALVTGVPFLQDAAQELIAGVKGSWLNIEIPENISFDCARFLLSAPRAMVLSDEEREVYGGMQRYRLLELNLDSILNVKRPWTPDKTRNVGDRKVCCKSCSIKRSITIMSHVKEGICGFCIANEDGTASKASCEFEGSDELNSCWVECSVKSCRAQYVVEDVPSLRVRPKCHYCRTCIPCPYLDCTRCANRIVVPTFYRSTVPFLCPACSNPERANTTIVTVESTTRALIEDNGLAWLGIPDLTDMFEGKSSYKLAQKHGIAFFSTLKPCGVNAAALTLGGKKVHNSEDVVAQVENRVGRGEVELGDCPLCFREMTRSKLVPTCGRSGCKYRVDETCLAQWYGGNKPGRLLNLMQTMCPFCRRAPSTKILRRYNPGIAALGGLRDAVNDKRWYYAWCNGCAFAKQALERQCCQGDQALDSIENFTCDDCSPEVAKTGGIGRVTECPSCGVIVEKEYGCNHITCQCGQHFCHVCGLGTDEEGIYDHLFSAHGGLYDDDDMALDQEEE